MFNLFANPYLVYGLIAAGAIGVFWDYIKKYIPTSLPKVTPVLKAAPVAADPLNTCVDLINIAIDEGIPDDDVFEFMKKLSKARRDEKAPQ